MFIDDPSKLAEKLGPVAFLAYVLIKDLVPAMKVWLGKRPSSRQYRVTQELVKAAWTAAHERDLLLLNERIEQIKTDLNSHSVSNDKHFGDLSNGLTSMLKTQHSFVERAGDALSSLTERLAAVEAHLEHLLRKTN